MNKNKGLILIENLGEGDLSFLILKIKFKIDFNKIKDYT